ncbi:ABC transporter permease [Paenibacillus sp.]|uniref:ABC transporter permease n=1 Tax=Paenibacillus sp. TaxID=58172 RepID=UPI002D4A77B9|nr:ABC transporter permease [Paenibacillus sp.]HZG88465.1 ABC transporter permease [Paenibacillus sp.]
MNKLLTVIKFTYGNAVKQRSFLISTAIFAVILTALSHLPSMMAAISEDDGPKRVALVHENSALLDAMNAYFEGTAAEPAVVVVAAASEEEARQGVEAKELEGYLVPTGETNANGIPAFAYRSKDALPLVVGDLAAALQAASQKAAKDGIGLTEEQAAKLFAPVDIAPVQLTSSDEGKSSSEIQLAFGLVYVLLFLLYMGVIGYGNTVATSITAEKSSRVMELLVSSVSPLIQMFGKIIGISFVGLTQLLFFLAVGAANLTLSQNSNPLLTGLQLRLTDIDPMLLVYFVIFYFLGYFIYSTAFAAVGSLVSRTEEVGQVIMPVTLLIIGAFFVAMYGLTNATSPFIVVMSFVPFFSPLVMFLRIGLTDPAPWEIALSIAISAAAVFGMGWLAAKIYRTGVLMYGKLPSVRELRRAMKAFDA